MSTGNGNAGKPAEPIAVGLRFEKGRLVLEFNDEREVSVPLSRYPTLLRARPAQRAAWQAIGRGVGFRWEALDLDLSVRGIMNGLPEAFPSPPVQKRSVPRRRKTRVAAA